ncbi:hypothetical protein TNCV_3585891 [Trichonephila clavipes]|nr:hypothetical protein TNCV_3585891 [Trichonephila clavipes]
MSSNLVPLKTRRSRGKMHVKPVEAQTSSRWYSVDVWRGWCQLRCPRHLPMIQKLNQERSEAQLARALRRSCLFHCYQVTLTELSVTSQSVTSDEVSYCCDLVRVCNLFYLSSTRDWLLEHLTPTDDVVSRVVIESSGLDQVVAIHSGMAAEWAGFVTN